MISSFFSKAKPIHFVVTSSVLLFVYIFVKFFLGNEPIETLNIFKQIILFGVCLFSIFVFDFLSGKNDLTKKNSYKILFFTLFLIMLPQTFLNSKILVSNLFVLLALRRIISLRSKKEIKKKLFDAAFWLSIATLLYFWASLFFILIFVALVLYAIADIKNWIIPFLGIIAVALLATGVLIVTNTDIETYISSFNYDISFDFSKLNRQSIIISSTIMFSYFVWALVYYFKGINAKSRTKKPAYYLVFIATLIALVIIIISPQKTGAEFIFLFAPLAIIMTNYLEMISEKWFKELLIWILIITPIISLVL
ncbi:DUF6427 family protein [Corallibacter sp.]|uniref:DUF6427 family protein n=1 Tax=Corallibacter sp. TaxID=2038084 RepID=UPI003A948710